MIKAILFDFYGTIANYGNMKEADIQTWKVIFEYISSKVKSITYEEFINRWNPIFTSFISLEEKSEESILLTKISKLLYSFNIECDSKTIARIGDMCLKTWQSYISFPDDMVMIFDLLKSRFKLGIVSNFDHPSHLRRLLSERRIANFFESVIISGEIGIMKPNSKIFYKALNELNVSPDETIFIGDNIIDDIDGARNIGCKTILIDRQNNFTNFKGKKINNLRDLLTCDFSNVG